MEIRQGFTLIELLVVIVIVGVVGGIATIILSTTLQNASKGEMMREVKQNGDFALSVMERMIRNATGVSPCLGSSAQLTITNSDGKNSTFSLSGPQIASNGGMLNGGMLTSNKLTASNLSFSCTLTPGRPGFVVVTFNLAGGGSIPSERARMDFRTSVSLRTY